MKLSAMATKKKQIGRFALLGYGFGLSSYRILRDVVSFAQLFSVAQGVQTLLFIHFLRFSHFYFLLHLVK